MIRWGVSPAREEEENEQKTMSVKNKRTFFISFTLNTAQNKKSPRLRQEDCTLFHFIPNRYPESPLTFREPLSLHGKAPQYLAGSSVFLKLTTNN